MTTPSATQPTSSASSAYKSLSLPTSDGEFLSWLADRLVYIYNESPHVDFVLALKRIASQTIVPQVVQAPLSQWSIHRTASPIEEWCVEHLPSGFIVFIGDTGGSDPIEDQFRRFVCDFVASPVAAPIVPTVPSDMPELPEPHLVGEAFSAAQMRDYGLKCRRATAADKGNAP